MISFISKWTYAKDKVGFQVLYLVNGKQIPLIQILNRKQTVKSGVLQLIDLQYQFYVKKKLSLRVKPRLEMQLKALCHRNHIIKKPNQLIHFKSKKCIFKGLPFVSASQNALNGSPRSNGEEEGVSQRMSHETQCCLALSKTCPKQQTGTE